MEITRGKIQKAKKVVIYGPEGIGKSTFAARFPGAVFIDTEGSTNDMDVARLPRPTSWNMLFDEIEYIKTNTDECKTLVIDTVDWAELLCVEHICAVHNKKGIEDFGYGNGYVYTKEEFVRWWDEEPDYHQRQWVAADGLIYQQFADCVQDYLVDQKWLDENQIVYAVIGVDFGGTKSAHSFTLTGFTKGFKQVVVLDEYYCKKRINPKQLQDDFIDFVRRAQSQYKTYEVYCDSAEQTLISGLETACIQEHVVIDIKNAIKGPINDRIAFYNSLIAQHRWKIMKHCTHIIAAFEEAVYDEKKKNMDVRLDDGEMNVDSLDSTEYSTESIQDEIMYIAA